VNLANLISLARLFAVPLIVWLILTGSMGLAFWTFVVAALSDAADGFIAKRFNQATVLGGYLDPLADKALLVSVYVTLGEAGTIDLWLVILVVFRDVMIIGGALLFRLLTRSLTMRPLMVSKINTVAQLTLAGVALGAQGLDLDVGGLVVGLTYVVAATTLISGIAYVVGWARRAAGMEPTP